MNRTAIVPLLAILAACSGETNDTVAESPTESGATIAVAALGFGALDVDELVATFEEATGADVVVTLLDTTADLDAFIRDDPAAAADVLMTASVNGVWRAADEGALRPLSIDVPVEAVPAGLRDPEGLWAGVGFSVLGIAYDVRDAGAVPETWSDLDVAEPGKQLCLPAFAVPGTQALVATLIGALDQRPAERLARRWLASSGGVVHESRADIVDGVASGECVAGIVAISGGSTESDLTSTLRFVIPEPAIGDVAGIGVARHAGNPELANRFVEWMLLESAFPGTTRNAPQAGYTALDVAGPAWQGPEAELLAERAGWR